MSCVADYDYPYENGDTDTYHNKKYSKHHPNDGSYGHCERKSPTIKQIPHTRYSLPSSSSLYRCAAAIAIEDDKNRAMLHIGSRFFMAGLYSITRTRCLNYVCRVPNPVSFTLANLRNFTAQITVSGHQQDSICMHLYIENFLRGCTGLAPLFRALDKSTALERTLIDKLVFPPVGQPSLPL